MTKRCSSTPTSTSELASPLRCCEEGRRRDQVRVEVPVDDGVVLLRVILEDRAVEDQPDEDRSQQCARPRQQTAMRDALEQPNQRRALQRPSDGDPLFLELQRNGDG